MAKNEFELLSPLEYQDLSRLFDDRNRCAHPSMLSIEEPYKPSAELARYHLRNTVVHFLQRPPVQGKAALDRIRMEINSEYFPIDPNLAVKYFQSGPLVRAKESLVRNLVIILTKYLLQETQSDSERIRHFSALKAIFQIYPNLTERSIQSCFSNAIRSIADSEWNKVIEYIYPRILGFT